MIVSNSLKNPSNSLLATVSPVRIQALATIFNSATNAINGWCDPRPGFLGLYPTTTPSCMPWRTRTVESKSMVSLSNLTWSNQKRFIAGKILSFRSLSNFLKNRLKVLWLAMPRCQSKIRCTTLSYRKVPACYNRVAPNMTLTIKPSIKSTGEYPRLDPGTGKSGHSFSKKALNPDLRYTSSISRRPPQGDTSLSVNSYINPLIFWVNWSNQDSSNINKGLRTFL